jgi:8-oxo-dGTP pyrophosphatase MutT (NUDIX family)
MELRCIFPLGAYRGIGVTRDEIALRLAAGSGRGERSDLATTRLLGDPADGLPMPPDRDLIPAAVLVPLVARSAGLTVLLTQRTAHLANHPGQISFPGGRIEADDKDALAAALRETQEEIGLAPEAVDVLGRLDDYTTVTGFRIAPFVGLLHPPLTLSPDSFEVAEVFEVPLDFILDPHNHQRHNENPPVGRRRYYYAIPFNERYIWGATAGMLVNLSDVLAISLRPEQSTPAVQPKIS